MAIPLEALQDEVIYCVLTNTAQHENVLMRGSDIRSQSDITKTNFQVLGDLPEHYVRVEWPLAEEAQGSIDIAIWQDPSGPELLDDTADSPRALSIATTVPVGVTMQAIDLTTYKLEAFSLMRALEPVIQSPMVDLLDKMLQRAPIELLEALQHPVEKRKRKLRAQLDPAVVDAVFAASNAVAALAVVSPPAPAQPVSAQPEPPVEEF